MPLRDYCDKKAFKINGLGMYKTDKNVLSPYPMLNCSKVPINCSYSALVHISPSAMNWFNPIGDSICGGIGISGCMRAMAAARYSGSALILIRIPSDIFARYWASKTRVLPHARQQYLPCCRNSLLHARQCFSGYIRVRLVVMAIVKTNGYMLGDCVKKWVAERSSI